jgi:hypothetical protein
MFYAGEYEIYGNMDVKFHKWAISTASVAADGRILTPEYDLLRQTCVA